MSRGHLLSNILTSLGRASFWKVGSEEVLSQNNNIQNPSSATNPFLGPHWFMMLTGIIESKYNVMYHLIFIILYILYDLIFGVCSTNFVVWSANSPGMHSKIHAWWVPIKIRVRAGRSFMLQIWQFCSRSLYLRLLNSNTKTHTIWGGLPSSNAWAPGTLDGEFMFWSRLFISI